VCDPFVVEGDAFLLGPFGVCVGAYGGDGVEPRFLDEEDVDIVVLL